MPSRRELLFGAFRPAAGPLKRQAAISNACLAQQNVVCRSCGEACPESAIRFAPRLGGAALPTLLASICSACGDCLAVCPPQAITLINSASATISEELVA
jgi:ferredoxin-type protein NapF